MAEFNIADFITKQFGSENKMNSLFEGLTTLAGSAVTDYITKNFGSKVNFANIVAVLTQFGKLSSSTVNSWPAEVQKIAQGGNAQSIISTASAVLQSEAGKSILSKLKSLFSK